MTSTRRVFALLVAALAPFLILALLPAPRADAQTISTMAAAVNSVGITHTIPRTGFRTNNQLNYSDCIDDDVVKVPVTVTQGAGYTLQAWLGIADCTPATARSGALTQCWLVASQVPNPTSVSTELDIPVRAIVAGYTLDLGLSGGIVTSPGTGGDTSISGTGGDTSISGTGGSAGAGGASGTSGTTTSAGIGTPINPGPEACVQPNASAIVSPTNFNIQFFLIDPSTNAVVGTASSWTGQFKLVGPQPPNNVSTGIGEDLLVVNFSYTPPTTDTSINTYNIYCDPAPGGDSAVDAGLLAPDASAGTAADCSAASSTVLMEGANATDFGSYVCGTAQKTSQSGNASNLIDGVPYHIAVAATDTFYNTGTLSTVGCGVPQPVNGFFKEYRNAGGQGGGGYCSFSMKREPAPLFALLALALGAALRRRRAT
ncbi:MAG TPA: hypothetical protein VGM44_10005 [Polyangiaceae bacterium]